MKKLLYFAMALGLVACQAEKVDVNGGANEVETNYLSVRIKTANLGTRADDYTANGGQYVDGTAAENAVGTVRFYFFDAEENAAAVKYVNGSYQSYYDWTAVKTNDTDHTNSVEKILEAVVVINTNPQDKIPASIVAVLNPGLVENLPTNPSLAELNEVVKNFGLTTAPTETSNSFLMTNSVYANGTTKVEAVDIAGHTYSTEAAALLNPVVIYVERVLAKVSMTTTLPAVEGEGMEGIYDTKKTVGEGENAKKIYVKFLGWNTTATADKSNLMKDINASWADDLMGAEPWTWTNHRSFWAINPEGVNFVYGPFRKPEKGEAPNVAQALTVGTGVSYPQENAAEDVDGTTTTTPTQVIIAAQLVGEDKEPFEVAEYAGKLYAGTEDVRQLIANAANVYKHSTTQNNDGTQQEYDKIKPEDLTFVTASADAGKDPKEMTSPRYVVYFVIDKEKVKEPLYKSTGTTDNEGKPVFEAYNSGDEDNPFAEVNAELKKLGSAKVWAEGNTYYYFDIRHLGTMSTKPGYYGVVRNHVYQTNVNALSGLGTPVYNPDEVIIPEKPQNDDTVIAAQIEILSWRIVANDYGLNWE